MRFQKQWKFEMELTSFSLRLPLVQNSVSVNGKEHFVNGENLTSILAE